MTFSLEKILSIDIETYIRNKNKIINQYELRGVHLTKFVAAYISRDDNPIELFAQEVPSKAEAVVNYNVSLGAMTDRTLYCASGIALIPSDIK